MRGQLISSGSFERWGATSITVPELRGRITTKVLSLLEKPSPSSKFS